MCNSCTKCVVKNTVYFFFPSSTLFPIFILFCLLISSPSAGETTGIQEVDQLCAIMLKSMPTLSLSLSGTWRGEPFHLFILIVCHLLLAQPDDEPSLLFICCPQDVACPWRGCSFFSLHFQYLIYFQYSQKGGTAGLEGTLTDSQDEKIKKWHWRKLYPVFQFFPS